MASLTLGIIATVLGLLGVVLVSVAFFGRSSLKERSRSRRLVQVGAYGIFSIFLFMLIVIFLYSKDSDSEKVIENPIEEKEIEKLPDISKRSTSELQLIRE